MKSLNGQRERTACDVVKKVDCDLWCFLILNDSEEIDSTVDEA